MILPEKHGLFNKPKPNLTLISNKDDPEDKAMGDIQNSNGQNFGEIIQKVIDEELLSQRVMDGIRKLKTPEDYEIEYAQYFEKIVE